MKIRIISFCLLLVAIFGSCKKEDYLGDASSGNPYIPKLKKILVNNELYKELTYNDSSLIKQENTKYDFTLHRYNKSGQLTSSEYYANDDILSNDHSVSESAMKQTAWVNQSSGKKGGTISYEYNSNGLLVKSTTSRPSLSCTEYSEYSYDSNNRMKRQMIYFENQPSGYIDYTYDNKGNLSGEVLYNLPQNGDAELVTSTRYTYDSEPNPFKAYSKSMIPGVNTNANNILKETYTIHLSSVQGSDKVQVTENSYKYNALGYPVSKNGNVTYVY